MIKVSSKGDYSKTFNYLNGLKKKDFNKLLEKYAKKGVDLLKQYTPKDTGLTADSWNYDIVKWKNADSLEYAKINFNNSNLTSSGIPVVVLIRYGHATKNGAYVYGNDFVTPVIQNIFDEFALELWKEVNGK